MGDVVNLRRARKAHKREDEARAADAARLAFGRTKSEKSLTQATQDNERRKLDAHRRDGGERE